MQNKPSIIGLQHWKDGSVSDTMSIMSDKTPRVPTYGPQQKHIIDGFLAAANPKVYDGQDIVGSFLNSARSSVKK